MTGKAVFTDLILTKRIRKTVSVFKPHTPRVSSWSFTVGAEISGVISKLHSV